MFRSVGVSAGWLPNEHAAMKVLYLVATQHRPNRENLTGKINGWKHILNALTVHYGDWITTTNDHNDQFHKESDSPRRHDRDARRTAGIRTRHTRRQ